MAERFGLSVLKRVQTGTAARHFADFELSGPADRIFAAWEGMKQHVRHRDFDRITYGDNPDHADYGKPFIACGSVWCEVKEPVAPPA